MVVTLTLLILLLVLILKGKCQNYLNNKNPNQTGLLFPAKSKHFNKKGRNQENQQKQKKIKKLKNQAKKNQIPFLKEKKIKSLPLKEKKRVSIKQVNLVA